MDLANKLPKIKDQEKESKFGYVFAVSGPGGYRDQIIKQGSFNMYRNSSAVSLLCVAVNKSMLYCSLYIL